MVPEAWAEETQAAGRGPCAGQQSHLSGGHVSRGDHSGLWVTLQLPQVLEQGVQQVLVDTAGAGVMDEEA